MNQPINENPLGLDQDYLASIVALIGLAENLPDEFPDAETCDCATELREKLNRFKLDVDSRRVQAKKPYEAEVRRINGLAEVLFAMVKPAIQRLDAARKKYRDAAAKPVVSSPVVTPGGITLGIPDLTSMQASGKDPVKLKSRTVKVLDIVDPAVIPREFLVPDTAAITAALKAGQHVPGCLLRDKEVML